VRGSTRPDRHLDASHNFDLLVVDERFQDRRSAPEFLDIEHDVAAGGFCRETARSVLGGTTAGLRAATGVGSWPGSVTPSLIDVIVASIAPQDS
jgi:hypothetical protein